MERRDFVKKSLAASAALSFTGLSARAAWRKRGPAPEMAPGGISHPPYFDGMTYLSDDPADLKASGLCGLILDVSAVETIDGKFVRPLKPCLKSIARARKELAGAAGLLLATRGSQVAEAASEGKTAVFLQFQSCEPMTGDVDIMEAFYELGLRVLQITHHSTNPFGGGSLEKEWTGLTEAGFKAVEKMNDLGIIPDLSHGNENLAQDVLKSSKKPVIASHTACRAIVNNARCLPDSVIKGIADSGGVVGIFSMSFWLTSNPEPTVADYVRQLEHVISAGGVEAAGISNDYTIAGDLASAEMGNNNAEAVKGYFPWWTAQQKAGILGFDELPKHCVIPELNNIRRFFTIQAALEKRGHKPAEVEKIMGGNWVRVLTECLG